MVRSVAVLAIRPVSACVEFIDGYSFALRHTLAPQCFAVVSTGITRY
jgi:hypothetical protein